MYVCIYICLYACMYAWMYVCIYAVIGNVYFDHHSKSFSTMTLFNFLFDTSRRRNRLERHSVRAGHFHDHVNIRLLRPPSRGGPIVSAKPSWNEQVGGRRWTGIPYIPIILLWAQMVLQMPLQFMLESMQVHVGKI